MKSTPLPAAMVLILGIMCLLSPALHADEETERAALRVILGKYVEAVNSGDLSPLAPHLSRDVTGVMVTGEEVKGTVELATYWKKIQALIGPGGGYQVKPKVDQTDFYHAVTVSRGSTEDVVRLASGRELRFASLWTAVCRREEGAWKLVRLEAAMNPVDNVFISLKLQQAKLAWGAGGLLAGVLLALVVQYLRGRRAR